MEKLKMVSFNLRISFADDGINSFRHRCGSIIKKIKSELPDIICFQEASDESTDFLTENLPDYNFIFNKRNADFSGEGLLTAVLKHTFYVLGADFFWMSPTPNKPGSRYQEQSNCPRITQCILIQSKSDGKLLRLYNVHLDHKSNTARIHGIHSLLAHAQKQNAVHPAPLVIMGDFNAQPNTETINYCHTFKDIQLTDLTDNLTASFHDFGKLLPDRAIKIDYIFSDNQMSKSKITSYIWDVNSDGIYLTDHYPICVEFSF